MGVVILHHLGNWLHGQWFGYWKPSFIGNGPEGVAQSLIFGVAGYVVGRSQKRLHGKLDHIITYHPDIPDYKD